MFSSNPPKLFSLVLFFSICFSACGFWTGGGAGDNSNGASQTPFNAREIPTEIPFSTREPEVFQCEIVVSGFTGGEKTERKTFVARNGARRLTVFGSGEKTEISLLQIDAGTAFSIYPDKKVYTESVAGGRASLTTNGGDFGDFLTTGWLNAKANAAFESLGAENGLNKYLVRLNNSDASEILIFVDENLKIPVRQEFYSRAGADGGAKTLLYTIELKNFQTQADDKFFEPPPKDFRKVSSEEFDKIAREARQ